MVDFPIRVVVDPSSANRGLTQVRGQLQQTENLGRSLGRTLANTFAAIGIGAGISTSIRTIASFEQTLSTVQAISGATRTEFAALRDEAERLGSQTRFSASEAGEGLIFLARAGFTAEESLATLAPTLQLAQAGGLALGQAADIATNVLSGFRLEVDQATRVVDVLARTANSANTDVGQLGQALSFVAPVAAGVGVSIEETAAAIGVLSDAGIQSTRAGTGLRRVISSLLNPTGEAADIIRRLGVDLEDVNPQAVGLTTAITRLRDAGIGTAEALTIFGDRGGPAFDVLAAGIPRVIELNEELQNAGGTAEEIARIMDDNLNGALLQVRSATEAVILAIGEAGATGVLENFFRSLADGLRFAAANIDDFIDAAQAIFFFFTINFARQAIPAAILALRALAVAIITNPIGLLATALTAATAAFVAFSERIQIGGDNVGTALDFLISLVEVFTERFVGGLNMVLRLFGDFEIELGDFDFAAFVRGAANAIDLTIGVFEAGFRILINETVNATAAIGQILADVINVIPGLPEVEARFQNTGLGAAQIIDLTLARNLSQGTFITAVEDALGRAGERGAARAAAEFQAIDTTLAAPERLAPPEPPAAVAAAAGLAPGAEDRANILAREIELLNQEAQLLRLVGDERQILAAQLTLEEQIRQTLRETNEDLTEQQINDLARLSAAEAEQLQALVTRNLELQRQAGIIDELQGPEERALERQASLNALYDEGRISLEEYNRAQRELNVLLTSFDNTVQGGLANGFARIIEQTNELGRGVSDVLVNTFDRATQSIVDFARTGEFSIRAFFSSIAEQLLQLATNQLFAQLLGGGFGGGGGGGGLLGGILGGLGGLLGFQNGGSFNVGGSGGPDSQVVAFRASPNERVSVQTPSQQREGGPSVNVQPQNIRIVNVIDPSEAVSAIDSAAGEEVILNTIRNNSREIQRIVGG